MLIDRNDELAVLHEKAHLQEAQVAAGNLDMGLRDNEVRRLQPALTSHITLRQSTLTSCSCLLAC
jgi:hypothetical protein